MINIDETRRILREVVEEFGPEHQQEQCVNAYERDGAPVCIAAQVMHRVMTPEQWSDVSSAENRERAVLAISATPHWPFDHTSTKYLDAAQRRADQPHAIDHGPRSTWGEARAFAERMYALHCA